MHWPGHVVAMLADAIDGQAGLSAAKPQPDSAGAGRSRRRCFDVGTVWWYRSLERDEL